MTSTRAAGGHGFGYCRCRCWDGSYSSLGLLDPQSNLQTGTEIPSRARARRSSLGNEPSRSNARSGPKTASVSSSCTSAPRPISVSTSYSRTTRGRAAQQAPRLIQPESACCDGLVAEACSAPVTARTPGECQGACCDSLNCQRSGRLERLPSKQRVAGSDPPALSPWADTRVSSAFR